MQERKTVNRYILQVAGPLFANPSNPASAALCLIFPRGFGGSKTAHRVSLRPGLARAVTHWVVAGNSGKGLTVQIDNYWLGCCGFLQLTTAVSDRSPSRAGSLPHLKCARFLVGASLLAKRPARSTQSHQTQKSPVRRKPNRAFQHIKPLLKQHSWSCAYQSNAAPPPDPPGSRCRPNHRIPPWRSCAGCGA